MEHKLCLIVPFRDSMEMLFHFVPHMSKFLSKKEIKHSIFVVNQADDGDGDGRGRLRFNRASLMNVGFLYATRSDPECDYVGLHHVDYFPLSEDLSYKFPLSGPVHFQAVKHHYATFIGGVLLMTVADFELIGGFSNQYWGWGLEDDELYHRLIDAGITVQRPEGILIKHIHGSGSPDRDKKWCNKQWDRTRRRDREGGFRTVDYDIESIEQNSIEGYSFQLLNVALKCNKSETPWCDPNCEPVKAGCSRGCDPIRKEDDIRPGASQKKATKT